MVEAFRIRDAAHRAQVLLAQAGRDVAAGDVRVLPVHGVADSGDRNLVGREAIRIDPDVDGAFQPAHDVHLADADGALDLHLHDLVRQLRQLAARTLARERDGEHGRKIVVGLADNRRVRIARQVAEHGADAIPHVLGGGLDVAREFERDGDKGRSCAADRLQFLDAFNGVERFFDGL